MSPRRLAILALCTLCTAFAHAQSAQDHDQTETKHPRIGDTTRRLLAEQAEGRHAGTALPMLGPTATLAMQRYLDSYNTKIPPFFDTRVGGPNPSGNSR